MHPSILPEEPTSYWNLVNSSLIWVLAFSPLQLAFQWVMNQHLRIFPDLLKITGWQLLVFFLAFLLGGIPFFPHPLPIPRALLAFFFSLFFLIKRYDTVMDRGTIIGTSAFTPILFMALDFGIGI